MPLEAGDGFISGLVATNPVNATDQVAQGDDHLRLIKTAIKGSFPNVNAAVNFAPTEANLLASLTALSVIGRATNSAGVPAAIAAGANDRILRRVSSALDFGQLTAGMFPATVVPDAALSANVPLLSASNNFAGATQTINAVSAVWQAVDGAVQVFLRAASASSEGRVGLFSNHALSVYTNSLARITISSGGNFDFKAGTVTTTGTSASEVGYNGAPQNVQDANYTLVLADRGKTIYKSAGGAGETITIPSNASVAFPVGTIIRIVNNGGGDLTIAITSDTLSLAGAGTTGSRTLGDHGVAAIEKVSTTEWFISGVGLS